jgi:NAD-dependent SIR2 family protein deacetylase
MKRLNAVGALLIAFLAACATFPADGDAVECDTCRAIWIRLYPSSGGAGIYRLKHEEKREACPDCEKLAARYFQTGKLPPRCPHCGGNFIVRPVSVTR